MSLLARLLEKFRLNFSSLSFIIGVKSASSLTILIPLGFTSISLVLFYVDKLLFSFSLKLTPSLSSFSVVVHAHCCR